MTDIVRVIKQLISVNPSLKQKLLEQGIITEKDGDIVILKPEAFEIVSSNSADMAGEKHEWLKQSAQSIDPPANIKIQNETNTRFSRKSAVETKNSPANGKTEFSKAAGGSMEKSVEKTHSSNFVDDPKKLEIVGSSRKKVTVYFSEFGDELKFDGEDVVISRAYSFQIMYNDIMTECVPTKNGYVCGEDSLKDAVRKIARIGKLSAVNKGDLRVYRVQTYRR